MPCSFQHGVLYVLNGDVLTSWFRGMSEHRHPLDSLVRQREAPQTWPIPRRCFVNSGIPGLLANPRLGG